MRLSPVVAISLSLGIAAPSLAWGEAIFSPYLAASYSMRVVDLGTLTTLYSDFSGVKRQNASISQERTVANGNTDIDLTVMARGGGFFPDLYLGASGEVSFDTGGRDLLMLASGSASAISFVKYDFAPFNGRRGFINLAFDADGTISGGGVLDSNDFAGAQFLLDSGPAVPMDPFNLFGDWSVDFISGVNNCDLCQQRTFETSDPQLFSMRVPMVWGEWTGIWMSFNAGVSLRERGRGVVTSNFGGTLNVLSMVPTDLDGVVIDGAEFTSISNVPEPASTLLLLGGFAAAGFRAYRRAFAPSRRVRSNGLAASRLEL